MIEPKVGIVIINWNGLSDTIECLRSLENIRYHNYNVIVVDNNSYGNDAATLKNEFSNIKLIELKKNLGFANANNVGILIALSEKADYILLLNNDTIVDADFLLEMIKIAETDARIGILCPKMYYYDDRNRFWFAGES
jgi:GT2 family glycosyltransferase